MLLDHAADIVAVFDQRPVNGDLNDTVLGTTAGVYLRDRFLACKDKAVLPGSHYSYFETPP